MARGPLVAAVVLAAVSATAHAATVTGSAADPSGDSKAGPGTDIVAAAWSFDDAAGRLTVSVTFAATPTDSDWGAINASARDASQAGCSGASFAVLRGTNRSGSASGSIGTAADGQQPDGSTGASNVAATNVKSDDGRATTLEATHPRLVGRKIGCVSITLSRSGVKDSIDVPATATAGPRTPPPPYSLPPGANPGPAGPAGSPAAVRLGTGRVLRFRKGKTRVALTGVQAGMSGRLRLRLASETTLATGRFTARRTEPILVRLVLTRPGRSRLRRQRSGQATLTVRTTLRGATAQRRYAVRYRRLG